MAGRIRGLRRSLLLALVALTPLIFLPDVTLDAFNLPKLVLLTLVVAVAFFLLVLDWSLSGRAPEWGGALVPTLGFIAPIAISWAAVSSHQTWALIGQHNRYQGLLPYLLFVCLALLVADAFRDRPRGIVVAVVVSAAVVALYAVVQGLGLDYYWAPGETSLAYPPSTIGHFNFVGGYLAMGLGPAIWLWATATGRLRLVWTAATIAIVVGVVLSFSQGPWAAAVAGAVITAAYSSDTSRNRTRIAWAVVGMIAAVVLGSVLLSGIFRFDVGATARSRAGLWSAALGMAAESPLFGSGPNAFVLEGNMHRGLDVALDTELTPSDDPHSIPLAFLANTGVLGLAGFLTAAYWGITRARRAVANDPAAIAFLGMIVAYLVQALVTIDVPVLRLGFWVAIGGIGASSMRAAKDASRPGAATRVASVAIAGAVAIAVMVATISLFFRPDALAQGGLDLLEDIRPEDAAVELQRAIDARPDPEYRIYRTEALGLAALDAGPGGRPVIDELLASAGYLRTFPDARGNATVGHYVHAWGWFDPAIEPTALSYLQEALRLNPSDLNSRIEASESLISVGRTDEAVSLLEPVASRAAGRLPEFWGAYSIASLVAGDTETAVTAATEATESGGGCRALLAGEAVRLTSGGGDEPPSESLVATLAFQCERQQLYFFARLVPEDLQAVYLPDP